jgi:hypothetical protein
MRSHRCRPRTTIVLSLAAAMFLGSAQAGFATSLPAPVAGSGSPASSRPDGSALVRQSFAAMARSLHAVHSEVTAQENTHRFHARASVSGDCTMTSATHRGQVWERGTRLYSKAVAINLHFIEIGAMTGGSHTWMRAASTGNRWRAGAQPGREEDTAVLFLAACPLQQQFLFRAKGVPHITNLGPTRVRTLQRTTKRRVCTSAMTSTSSEGRTAGYESPRSAALLRTASAQSRTTASSTHRSPSTPRV